MFDPRELLAALEREHVAYVLVGEFARIVHGTDELTRTVEVCPSLKPQNLRRLERALSELDAKPPRGKSLALDPQEPKTVEARTPVGGLRLDPRPAGTDGYEDLKRRASREPIGAGLRPQVASLADLARMLAAQGHERTHPVLRELRLLAELEPGRGLGR